MVKPASQFTVQETANMLGVPIVVRLPQLLLDTVVRPNDTPIDTEPHCQNCGNALDNEGAPDDGPIY